MYNKGTKISCNVAGVGYTLKHRNCVQKLIQYYCKRAIGKRDGNGVIFTKKDYDIMLSRGICHDMDKILCCLAYPQLTSDYLHRMFNGHHEENLMGSHSKYDLMEQVLDIESGRYTKPSFKNCAYDIFHSFKPDLFMYVEPYLQLFNLNKSRKELIKSIQTAVNRDYYERDLHTAIRQYTNTTHILKLDCLARLDDKGCINVLGKPAPYRHENTQRPFGNVFSRPSRYIMYKKAQNDTYLYDRELINGKFEAQIFDYDALCSIPSSEVENINAQCYAMYTELLKHKGGTR